MEETTLSIYDDDQLVTVIEPINENGGYWKPVQGAVDWSTSEDIRMNVEFIWVSAS